MQRNMRNLLILFVIILADLVVWSHASAFVCDRKQIHGEFLSDLYYTNGNEFFVADGKLFIILWKYIDTMEGTADSIIMSCIPGENIWEQKMIPGKAYYLGKMNNNELCSIEKRKGMWKLSFYTLEGVKRREIEHKYPKQHRELDQDLPIPLVCPDGSIVFYTRYDYDLRNPVLSFVLNWLSGGHGSIPRADDYIEILPSLLKGDSARNKEVAYIKLVDASRSTVIGFSATHVKGRTEFEIKESTSGSYKIYQLLRKDGCVNYYKKDTYVIALDDNVILYDDLFRGKYVASKPDFIPHCARLRDPGGEQSDMQMLEQGRIFFVSSSARFGIYDLRLGIYDPRSKKWEITKIPMGGDGNIYDLRLYKWGHSLYIGKWYVNKVEIYKCDIEGRQLGSALDN